MAAFAPLWSDIFLDQQIRALPEYQAILEDPTEFNQFVERARDVLRAMDPIRDPSEETTKDHAIRPLLSALGWPEPEGQRRLTPNDVIDYILHLDDDARKASLALSERQQVLDCAAIVECKPWRRDLDARNSGSNARLGETAAQQTQRYLLSAGTDSRESLRWAILANGAQWRIYSYRARPRDRFWQVDLEALLVREDLFSQVLADDDAHQLRIAWLLLRRDSWIVPPGERESFLDRLLAEGRRSDQQVADNLRDVIFRRVYRRIASILWSKQPEAESGLVAQAAQTLLYRILFLCFAEDRGMLDPNDDGYGPISLRQTVRDVIHDQQRQGGAFSTASNNFWNRLSVLRRIVDDGDESIGVPAYNGGLFAPHALIDEVELNDREFAAFFYDLSHADNDGDNGPGHIGDNGGGRVYINYRNLAVQQLGGVYEKLLEYVPRREDGEIDTILQPYARKDSGSYYTPQELVDLIVEQTLQPLLDERIAAFEADPTAANDPAEALLALRVLDPAMGSGHFLITALDWLTDRALELLERQWPHAPKYVSPLRARLDEIQRLHPDLDDHALVQRIALKRCIHGVDKNAMAVRLARVALWLHTFQRQLPFPYIERNLITGDSLLGALPAQATGFYRELGRITVGEIDDAEEELARSSADQLGRQLDLVIQDIERTRGLVSRLDNHMFRIPKPINLFVGLRWHTAGMSAARRADYLEPLRRILRGYSPRARRIIYEGENTPGLTPTTPEYRQIRDPALAVIEREDPLHWPIAFPLIWRNWSADRPEGGFDAIVSNPPWDRIKLQEVEWWAARREEVAKVPTAAARKRMIADLRAAGDPLIVEYDAAAAQAAEFSDLMRNGGDYPLLGKGDINLYSLLVERSLSLLRPRGVVGLLTPSGIYADSTAAEFFRSMSTTGRIAGIYDFENRRSANPNAQTAKWFPDVHPQFKFCATIFAGSERRFDETECGFYLDGKADLQDADRVFPLTPDDFARINPNTGTAPTLRSPVDAKLVRRIYRNHPVLVDRSSGEARRPYEVRQLAMFHMTNDSHLFRTAEQLKDEGCYPVAGHRYQRGSEQWAPLYQGRMIHHFDHRANAVGFNPESQDSPYFSIDVTDEQKQDPSFFPAVRYWVSTAEIESRLSANQTWVIGFRDITRSADERTMIATIAPWAAFGNQTPLLLPDPTLTALDAALLTANLSSLALDFVAKRKVQGTHMNWYILEQLPVIAPADYDREFGETTAGELVRDHVLRLSYTAHDLAPFARDLGYAADPFPWDPEERRQLRARLDALYFHLYGLGEEDTAYVLDQFPVLEKNERKEHGRYQTKELVLAYHRALTAGDTASEISPGGER